MFLRSTKNLATIGVVVSVLFLSAPGSSADSLDAGNGRIYRLNPESTYQFGCFPPCLCPILVQQGVAGTFKLKFAGTVGGAEHEQCWPKPYNSRPDPPNFSLI